MLRPGWRLELSAHGERRSHLRDWMSACGVLRSCLNRLSAHCELFSNPRELSDHCERRSDLHRLSAHNELRSDLRGLSAHNERCSDLSLGVTAAGSDISNAGLYSADVVAVCSAAGTTTAQPQYSRRAVRFVSSVERTVDAREAMRQTAEEERAARAEALTAGSLRDSTTAQATRTASATRVGRERVGKGPAGPTAGPHLAAQKTRCARKMPVSAL